MKKIFFLRFKYIFSVVFIAGAVMLFALPADAKSVEISWNVKKNNLTDEVDYFQLQRRTGDSGAWDVVSPYGSISPNEGELVRDVYHYTVQFDTGSETVVHQYKIKTFMKSSQSKETKPVITSTKCVSNQCNVIAVNLEEDEDPQAVTNTLIADLKAITSPGQSVRLTKFSVNNIQHNNGRNEVETNDSKITVAWETRRKGNDNVEEVEIFDGDELIKKLSSKELDANLNNSSAEINLSNRTHYIGIKIISNGFVVSEKEAGLYNGRKYGPIKVIVSESEEPVQTRETSPARQEQDEEESDDPAQREERSDDSTTPAREDNPVEIVMPTELNLSSTNRWIEINPKGDLSNVSEYQAWYSPSKQNGTWINVGVFNDNFTYTTTESGFYGVHVVVGDTWKDEKYFEEQPVEIELPVVASLSSIGLFTIDGISHSDSMGGQSAVVESGDDIRINWKLNSGSEENDISKFKEILLLYVSHEEVKSISGICQPNPVPQQNCFGDELTSIPANSGVISGRVHEGETEVSLSALDAGIYYIVPMFMQDNSTYYVKGEYIKVEINDEDSTRQPETEPLTPTLSSPSGNQNIIVGETIDINGKWTPLVHHPQAIKGYVAQIKIQGETYASGNQKFAVLGDDVEIISSMKAHSGTGGSSGNLAQIFDKHPLKIKFLKAKNYDVYYDVKYTADVRVDNDGDYTGRPVKFTVSVTADRTILISFSVNIVEGRPQISWSTTNTNTDLIDYFQIWRRQVGINPAGDWKKIYTTEDSIPRQAVDDEALIVGKRYQYGMHVVMKGGSHITEGECGLSTGTIVVPEAEEEKAYGEKVYGDTCSSDSECASGECYSNCGKCGSASDYCGDCKPFPSNQSRDEYICCDVQPYKWCNTLGPGATDNCLSNGCRPKQSPGSDCTENFLCLSGNCARDRCSTCDDACPSGKVCNMQITRSYYSKTVGTCTECVTDDNCLDNKKCTRSGNCIECLSDSDCSSGSCVNGACTCIPQCSGKECGDDGCGGICGTCPNEYGNCVDNQCFQCPNSKYKSFYYHSGDGDEYYSSETFCDNPGEPWKTSSNYFKGEDCDDSNPNIGPEPCY